jgi:MOSC domain-containing protein YiiM
MQVLTISASIVKPLFVTSHNEANSQSVMSAIRKTPVSTIVDPTPIGLKPMGLVGDEQADLTVHGGLDKAVYLYPAEHYAFWQTVSTQANIAQPLAHGKMGENLTIQGLPETHVWIGDQLQFERDGQIQAVLRVESPRNPCFKFNVAMGFKHAVKMMVQSGFCGFYCSVVQPGILTAGDKITVIAGDRVFTITQRFAFNNRSRQNDLF